MTKEKWMIWVSGYGSFEFEGTEAEAEEMRSHKANWEAGRGLKYRVANQTEVDRLTAELVGLWADCKGAPSSLLKRISEAKKAQTTSAQ